jgi:hypothetical protein
MKIRNSDDDKNVIIDVPKEFEKEVTELLFATKMWKSAQKLYYDDLIERNELNKCYKKFEESESELMNLRWEINQCEILKAHYWKLYED